MGLIKPDFIRSSHEDKTVTAPASSSWEMLLLQASAASVAGFIGTPLMNISNKCTLPGIKLHTVLHQTSKQPFLGGVWSSFRQFITSIRGTVAVAVLNSSATNNDNENNGIITAGNFCAAVCLAATAESLLAGVLVEIPETRIQSGLSRYSFSAIKSFPFILIRNCLTAISPTFIIMHTMNAKRQQELDRNSNNGGTWEAKNRNENNLYKISKYQPEEKEKKEKATSSEWQQAIFRTLGLSTSIAILVSPIQGISSRIIQEQSLTSAISNTRADFRWENKSTTIARVLSRALYTGFTGTAITIAFLTGKTYFEL
jgi:hypothetical protein